MKIYGYCRISTPDQSLDRQERNIKKEYPNAIIIREVYTGRSMQRPMLMRLYNRVKDGDTIVFDEVSRMSRDAEEGYKAYQDLFNRGVNLVFLKEPHLNTETYKSALLPRIAMTGDDIDVVLEGVNQYLMRLAEKQIKLAFERSQAEVDYLRQRTIEGMETARLKGKQIGGVPGKKLHVKKEAGAKQLIRELSKDFDGKMSDNRIITLKLAGISRNTFYKYKKEMLAERDAEAEAKAEAEMAALFPADEVI